MVKKKSTMSLFSTLVQQINNKSSSSSSSSTHSSAEYHRIDNEYYAAFHNVDDIQQFHNNLIKKQSINNEPDDDLSNEQHSNEMDMKTFAEQFLIDSPESISNSNQTHTEMNLTQSIHHSSPINYNRKPVDSTSIDSDSEINRKRQRRNIKDLPQSSHFLFMSDDENGNIFDSLIEKRSPARTNRIAYEDMSSILLTLDVKQQKKKKSPSKKNNPEPTIGIELAEPSLIKTEPIEQLVITHINEAKEEPIQISVIPTGPMSFGTSEYSHHLDDYVQNIHRSCSTNVTISDSKSSRPKRIRKRKKFFIEESESLIVPKRVRKKRVITNISPTLFTDAEIEQQFGERLPPTIKLEHNDEREKIINNQTISKISSVPETPIEKARANLLNALERGHGPDTFILKIRSRENKIFEVRLAIHTTTDWYSCRTKILSKIEEALRGLRVNWTKIDIRVDHFDIQICTSFQSTPMSSINMNSSCFLKVLSESEPLIVHIHDRRYPQQRNFIKCSCSLCSSNESSLPVIVSVSPAKTTVNRRLTHPTILRKSHPSLNSSVVSLYNIHTKFFKDLIYQYGTNTISSVTQCVLDLTLIVSVHSSLSYLYGSNDDYQNNYQQIIDPLKYTMNNSEKLTVKDSFSQPDILTFYQTIKIHRANIRNAQSMRTIIFDSSSNISDVKESIVLPKSTSNSHCLLINRIHKRQRNPIINGSNAIKQQAHFTPIIELKPILSTSTDNDEANNEESIRKVTKIISTNTIKKNSQQISTITTQEITPRIIRLSINKPTLLTNSIRLISTTSSHSIPSIDKIEIPPLVPKQINITKPISSLVTPAIKLANPVLISHRYQQPSN